MSNATKCHPACSGWLHINDPAEVQRCDECGRFQDDEAARAAHATECGCAWGALTHYASNAPNVTPGHAYCSEDSCFNLVPDDGTPSRCIDCSNA